MILNNKQENAIKTIVNRFEKGEQYSVLAGYAGTGKSTCVKFIVEALSSRGIDPDIDVCYSAYTGKACQVLAKKGNNPVATCHKLLWEFYPKDNGQFIRKRRLRLEYKVVIIDECSMIDADMLSTLLTHRETYFIFCGDPAQLPPVKAKGEGISGYDLLQKPHAFLDEVMRQAAESDIIRLSMQIREGKPIEYYKGIDAMVLPKTDLVEGMLTWADQILVGTNAVRTQINNKARELLGKGEEPEPGDRVICLHNNWDISSRNGNALVNGTTGYLKQPFQKTELIANRAGGGSIETIRSTIICDDDDRFYDIGLDPVELKTGTPQITDWKRISKINKFYNSPYMIERGIKNPLPDSFAYGYAITCWKAQGSEWDKVLIIEENFPFNREEHKRFLYTAITRASQKVVLVRNV